MLLFPISYILILKNMYALGSFFQFDHGWWSESVIECRKIAPLFGHPDPTLKFHAPMVNFRVAIRIRAADLSAELVFVF